MENFFFCTLVTRSRTPHVIEFHCFGRLFSKPKAATWSVLQKMVFLEILQNPKENTCARVFFNKEEIFY